jgi:hypothetical protein
MPLHKGENPYIYGLHDKGGEHLMIVNGEAKGWVLVSEAIGSEANERGGGDYSDITGKGLGLIVRLNQSYGENGTIPREKRYPEFAQRVANFVEDSKGANIWLIGNEMNFAREQPRREGSGEPEVITPRRYAECYKLCRRKIKALKEHKDDLVVVGAMAPWNAQTSYEADPQGQYPANPTGDWINYMRDILLAIGPDECDAIAIHAYSHGYAADLVFSDAKMNPPFQNRHYHFYTYKDQMEAIPKNMRHLPVYLTEANGDREEHGEPTWPFGNNGWIKNAYKEINNWNKSGQQQIRCVILFRWIKDPLGWSIDGKPEVQQDFKEAIDMNYKWNPDIKPAQPEPALAAAVAATPTGPGYRVNYVSHDTPGSMRAGQTLGVNLTLQNIGSFDWVNSGAQPFRLGFQWYDSNGQYVQFPANLDFRTSLPRPVPTNETVELEARLRTPNAPGNYLLRWDMVHEMVTWFSSQGDAGLVLPISVSTAPATEIPADPRATAPKVPVSLGAEDISATLPDHPTKNYPMRTHADIERIIIHHTATPPNVPVQRIAEFQVKNRDLPGIAYHFCITAEGKVYQTQYLETISAHAGANSDDSVGVCLIGNFMNASPPEAQLNATAALLAQLANMLGLAVDNIVGYSEIVTTGSPGATWRSWKGPLINRVRRLMNSNQPIAIPTPQPSPEPAPAAAAGKIIEHYLLFWHRSPGDWAEWDLQGALDYIARFKPAIGFDIEQAKAAKYVTIVGGSSGVPANAERILRAAGCQVERIDGGSEVGTRQLLQQLAAQGQRFKSLK